MQFPYFLPLLMQIVLPSCTQVVTAISYLWDKENQIHGIQEVNYLTTTITVSLAAYSMLVPLQVTTACLRKTLMYRLSLFLMIVIFLTWSKLV